MSQDTEDPRFSPGKRRPTLDDMPLIMDRIAQGESLLGVCNDLGIHQPSAYTMIHNDIAPGGLCDNYVRACEMRSDVQAEQVTQVSLAAALRKTFEGNVVDPAGAQVFLNTIKWTAGRMAPKKSPELRVRVLRDLSDADLDAQLLRLEYHPSPGTDADT